MPFPWSPEIEDEICAGIAGGESLGEVCSAEGMPSEPTVYRRLASDEAFAKKMVVARSSQQESEVDKCVQMADDATEENWQVVKLRIWARMWRIGKLAPRKYGEKVSAELTGPNGSPLSPAVIQIIGISPKPDDTSGTAEEDR